MCLVHLLLEHDQRKYSKLLDICADSLCLCYTSETFISITLSISVMLTLNLRLRLIREKYNLPQTCNNNIWKSEKWIKYSSCQIICVCKQKHMAG